MPQTIGGRVGAGTGVGVAVGIGSGATVGAGVLTAGCVDGVETDGPLGAVIVSTITCGEGLGLAPSRAEIRVS